MNDGTGLNQAERSKRTLSPRMGESARRRWTNEDAQILSSPNMVMEKVREMR